MGEVELKVIPMKSGDKMKKFDVDDTDKPCKEDKGGIKKDNEFNRIMSVDSEFTGKTTIVSKVKLGKFGQKKKMETVLIMPREIVGGKTQEEDDHNPLTGDEKGSVEEKHKGKHERPLDGEALGHTCNLWRREVIRNTEYAEEKEHKAFKHFKSEKTETVNKVNVPEVYQKKAEGSLYKNGDEKVSVVEERFLHIDSSVDKELGKDRIEIRKVKGKAKANLEAQVRLGSCYQKRSGPRRRLTDENTDNQKKEGNAEDVLVISEEFEAEKLSREVKEFRTAIGKIKSIESKLAKEQFGSAEKACKILEWPMKSTEENNLNGHYEPVLCHQNPTKVDYANRIKDPEDGRTSIRIEKDVEEGKSMISAYYQKSANNESDILALNGRGKTRCCIDGCEKAIANQDKSLKVEVKDASA
ncbi:21594_t:CDS:2 [Gigaspora rosea]|nr:21594_t:CDS:2 [Gigaspora rosea]